MNEYNDYTDYTIDEQVFFHAGLFYVCGDSL